MTNATTALTTKIMQLATQYAYQCDWSRTRGREELKKADEAKEKLDAADAELFEAHHAQTDLLQKYASGTEVKIEIIMVHAQDHLMTAILARELVEEIINVHVKMDNLAKQINK